MIVIILRCFDVFSFSVNLVVVEKNSFNLPWISVMENSEFYFFSIWFKIEQCLNVSWYYIFKFQSYQISFKHRKNLFLFHEKSSTLFELLYEFSRREKFFQATLNVSKDSKNFTFQYGLQWRNIRTCLDIIFSNSFVRFIHVKKRKGKFASFSRKYFTRTWGRSKFFLRFTNRSQTRVFTEFIRNSSELVIYLESRCPAASSRYLRVM